MSHCPCHCKNFAIVLCQIKKTIGFKGKNTDIINNFYTPTEIIDLCNYYSKHESHFSVMHFLSENISGSYARELYDLCLFCDCCSFHKHEFPSFGALLPYNDWKQKITSIVNHNYNQYCQKISNKRKFSEIS